MELEYGVVYKMALCPTRQVLTHILETSSTENDDGIGFWRCHLCLQWHVMLKDEGRRLKDELSRGAGGRRSRGESLKVSPLRPCTSAPLQAFGKG
jgi:hypothetical protein